MSDDALSSDLTILPLAESGLLVEFANVIDFAIVDQVGALAAALDAARPPGLLDVVPSYRTLLVSFDPAQTDGDTLTATILELTTDEAVRPAAAGREVIFPVVYGGEFGPDLADVAAHTGLTPDDVCARHAAATYRVATMGFSPGFGFFVGMPPELTVPRRQSPRTRVPKGSVAIGGAQTGIYPDVLPGGWNIIGRTPLTMFDVNRAEPFLIQPGDTVRFAPVTREEYDKILAKENVVGAESAS
jgi:KipI family sensor histidine kinase inhibitor